MRHYPPSYLQVPDYLEPVKPLPAVDELARAEDIRRPFVPEGTPMPYMVDVVRTFRLLEGKERYIEIGTFDKGCLAYVTSLLSPTATIIDVDMQENADGTERLERLVRPGQRLVTVVGDSTSTVIVDKVQSALGGLEADAVFIDGNHAAPFCWADYCNYGKFVAAGGFMLFHDIYWQGAPECFGVAQAAEWIDRMQPMHVVFADHPVHRFFPWLVKGANVWGGVGILRM